MRALSVRINSDGGIGVSALRAQSIEGGIRTVAVNLPSLWHLQVPFAVMTPRTRLRPSPIAWTY
jgi:hypothetical protein